MVSEVTPLRSFCPMCATRLEEENIYTPDDQALLNSIISCPNCLWILNPSIKKSEIDKAIKHIQERMYDNNLSKAQHR